MSEKTDIKSMDLEELKTFFSDMGEKAFRAKQVYEWLHVRQVESFEEMTNLSKTLRERLDETCRIITLRKEQVQISKLDGTRKYLFLLEDGNVIESVLMKYKHGNSVCISSQVGCRMGCRFCASTLDGLVRGLAPAEMLDQIYQIGKDIGERISNVVVMGTGEPMDNFDNLVKFITLFALMLFCSSLIMHRSATFTPGKASISSIAILTISFSVPYPASNKRCNTFIAF